MNLIDRIRAGTQEAARRGKECPDENELAAFFDGGLGGEDRSRLRNHLADCDHCLRAVAFLGRSAEAARSETVPAALESAARARRFSPAPATRARVARRWAVAAALVTITSATIWKLDPGSRPAGDTGVRSGTATDSPSTLEPGAASHTPQLVFPTAGATLPAADVGFRWTRVPTAVSYGIRVVTLDGDVVWGERVFGTETSLPAELRLSPGEAYLVRVSALLAGGKTLDSEHVRFFVGAR